MRIINKTTKDPLQKMTDNFQKWYLNLNLLELFVDNIRVSKYALLLGISSVLVSVIFAIKGNFPVTIFLTLPMLCVFVSVIEAVLRGYSQYSRIENLFNKSCTFHDGAAFINACFDEVLGLYYEVSSSSFPIDIVELDYLRRREAVISGLSNSTLISYYSYGSNLILTLRDSKDTEQHTVIHIDREESVFDIVDSVLLIKDDEIVLQVPNNGRLTKEKI